MMSEELFLVLPRLHLLFSYRLALGIE